MALCFPSLQAETRLTVYSPHYICLGVYLSVFSSMSLRAQTFLCRCLLGHRYSGLVCLCSVSRVIMSCYCCLVCACVDVWYVSYLLCCRLCFKLLSECLMCVCCMSYMHVCCYLHVFVICVLCVLCKIVSQFVFSASHVWLVCVAYCIFVFTLWCLS